jgi:hypothetical protein
MLLKPLISEKIRKSKADFCFLKIIPIQGLMMFSFHVSETACQEIIERKRKIGLIKDKILTRKGLDE